MKKILPLFEKHVQWIALGLGGLYLAYMIWIYLIQAPVIVTGIGPTPLTPGEVDPYIHDSVSVNLDRAMHDPHVPQMDVPNFIDRFKAAMDFSDVKMWELAMIPDSQVLSISVVPTSPIDSQKPTLVKAIPVLPPAAVADFSTGKSNIQLTPPAGAAGNNPNPAPAPAVPANGVQAVAGTQDTSWVTVSYTIPASQIAAAFKAANIPPWTSRTSILEVHLWREESLPDGKWSDPKQIKAVNEETLLPFPAPNNAQQEQAFLDWAKAHVSDILQPAFFIVNKGDPWRAPGQIMPVAQAVALQPLDPTQTYPPEVLRQYSDDQRKAYFQAKFKLKQSQGSQNRRQPPTGPPDGQPGQLNRNTPAIGSIGSDVYAAPPLNQGSYGTPPPLGDEPGGAFRRTPPPLGDNPGAAAPGPDAGAPANPVTPPDLATQFPIPPGEFDPGILTTDPTGWAHDITVEPGHTYRYMVTYRIRNPVSGTHAAVIPPALAAVFDIQSPDGIWSKPINVASTTDFFVYANSPRGVSAARIKVYKWVNGVERSHVFQVNPGDIIGGKDGDVDYSTGWTVVDLRYDDPHNPDSTTILVMSPTGVLDHRDYHSDQNKKEWKDLDQQVSAATSADQLAGGANRP